MAKRKSASGTVDARTALEHFQDYLAPKLDVYEQAVYLYILRHSRLVGRPTVTVELVRILSEIPYELQSRIEGGDFFVHTEEPSTQLVRLRVESGPGVSITRELDRLAREKGWPIRALAERPFSLEETFIACRIPARVQLATPRSRAWSAWCGSDSTAEALRRRDCAEALIQGAGLDEPFRCSA